MANVTLSDDSARGVTTNTLLGPMPWHYSAPAQQSGRMAFEYPRIERDVLVEVNGKPYLLRTEKLLHRPHVDERTGFTELDQAGEAVYEFVYVTRHLKLPDSWPLPAEEMPELDG